MSGKFIKMSLRVRPVRLRVKFETRTCGLRDAIRAASEFSQRHPRIIEGKGENERERERDRLFEINHCVNYCTRGENDMQTSGRLLCSRRLKLWRALRTHDYDYDSGGGSDGGGGDDGMGIALRQRERDITRTASRNCVAACYEFIVSLLISSAGNFSLQMYFLSYAGSLAANLLTPRRGITQTTWLRW